MKAKSGIFAALRGLLDGGLATVQNRVELFAVELREEKCRIVEAIIWASAAVAFGVMALTLVTLAVIIFFWNDARVTALLIIGLVYAVATFLAWRGLRKRLNKTSAFSGTLSEIAKDRACLETKT